MPPTSWSKAQSAVFAAPGADPTLLTDVNVGVQRGLINVSAATAMKAPEYAALLEVVDVSGLQVSASLGLATLSSLSFGTNFKPQDWRLTKQWELVPVTGDADTEHEWGWEMPTITGQIRGVATGNTNYLQLGGSLSAAFNVAGTVAASNAIITQLAFGVPKRVGGPIPVTVAFQVSGLATHGSDPILEFHSDVEDPVEAVLSITGSGLPNPSFNALMYSVQLDCRKAVGGPLIVSRRYRRSLAAA